MTAATPPNIPAAIWRENHMRDPIFRAIYDASMAVEKCGGSVELTAAVTAVGAIREHAARILDERDAAAPKDTCACSEPLTNSIGRCSRCQKLVLAPTETPLRAAEGDQSTPGSGQLGSEQRAHAAESDDTSPMRANATSAPAPITAAEGAGLADELEATLRHARIFLVSREKMHPVGVEQWDTLMPRILAALRAAPAREEAREPVELFDGHAVLNALTEAARKRTSGENVADTLDAVVRLMRANRRAAIAASGGRRVSERDVTIRMRTFTGTVHERPARVVDVAPHLPATFVAHAGFMMPWTVSHLETGMKVSEALDRTAAIDEAIVKLAAVSADKWPDIMDRAVAKLRASGHYYPAAAGDAGGGAG